MLRLPLPSLLPGYPGTLVPDVLSKEGPWARCQEQGGESGGEGSPLLVPSC